MSRKRIASLAALACLALAAAGIATAAARKGQSTAAASATFAAATVSHTSSRTCTGADGTYVDTQATYTGTSTSSTAALNGGLEIRAHSIVNTTTGLGVLTGDYRVQRGLHGEIDAAVAGGNVVGSVTGIPRRGTALVATLAGAFAPDKGFSSGSLGTGSVAGAGVLFDRGTCTKVPPPKPPKPVKLLQIAGLDFDGNHHVRAAGSLTLDLTLDSTGAVSGGSAIFYVNYHFGSSVTISGLAVKKSDGSVAVDSGLTAFTDADGTGNVTRVVTGLSAATAQALLASPRSYDVELATSAGTLKAQLRGFSRHH